MLVEAAIIMPIVLLLVFGALEYGLAFRESAGVNHAARAGARTASALARQAEWDTGAPGFPAAYGQATRDAVTDALSGIGPAVPVELWIYRADANGDPIGSFGACSDCAGWAWTGSDFSGALLAGSSPWDQDDQDACVTDPITNPDGPDRIGVWVKANHDFITGLFGVERDITQSAVMRFEPFVGEGPCT